MAEILSLRELSILFLMLLELDLRLACLASSGSWGCNPLALAKRLIMSVRLMTPLSLPERLAPGMAEIADAEMAGATAPVAARCVGAVELTGVGPDIPGSGVIGEGGTTIAGVIAGVEGPDEAGDGASTTHMRCERVATNLATVCARVLYGFTWNTGNESLPSFTPRSDNMTEIKWMQDERSNGSDVDFVRSYRQTVSRRYIRTAFLKLTRTSTCDMLPITLCCASRTGRDETPSLFISSRAAAKGLSPLFL
jgi:hypothetical protein